MVSITEIPKKFIAFFNKSGWQYSHLEDAHVLRATNAQISHLEVTIVYQETGYAIFFGLPFRMNAATKTETMEYVIRVNLDIDIGTFKIDLSDGTFVYASYTNITDLADIPDAFIIQSFVISLNLIQKYGPGLSAVISGESDAETEYLKTIAE